MPGNKKTSDEARSQKVSHKKVVLRWRSSGSKSIDESNSSGFRTRFPWRRRRSADMISPGLKTPDPATSGYEGQRRNTTPTRELQESLGKVKPSVIIVSAPSSDSTVHTASDAAEMTDSKANGLFRSAENLPANKFLRVRSTNRPSYSRGDRGQM